MKALARITTLVAVAAGTVLLPIGAAQANVSLSTSMSWPSGSGVGATNLAGSFTFQNSNTAPQQSEIQTVTLLKLAPSCGAVRSGSNVCPTPDPSVFSLTSPATGAAGTACAGITFSVSSPDASGVVTLTPSSTVLLQPPGGAAGTDRCTVNLVVSVTKVPSIDVDATPGVQTWTNAYVQTTSSPSNLMPASGPSLETTVNRGTPGLSTTASVVAPGNAVSDVATLTAAGNGPVPTGTVTFQVYGPNDTSCTGTSQSSTNPVTLGTATSTNFPATTAGVYRFTASYSGDFNYLSRLSSCNDAGESVTVTTSGRYMPLTPARILDTRNGTGGISGPVGPGSSVNVQITGQGGVPASGVTAVALNVTVTQPTASGYLTLWPTGNARPMAANLNFTPGETVPNLVVVKVGTGGMVSLFNSAGSSHVIFDVAGWFSTTSAGNDGRYTPLTPARILDSRDGTGGGVRLGPGASLDVQVSGADGVPPTGVEAAVLNVAVTNTTAQSYLTVFPTGTARPVAANLNFNGGDTVSNRVMAKLGTGGKVTIYNNAGAADVIVDVNGWYTDATVVGSTGVYVPLVPARILDTRDGTGGIGGPIAGGTSVDVQITGQGGVPASGVSAVILNATVVGPVGPGYLTLSPTGGVRPFVSDLNYAAGETRPNLVVVKVGAGGKVNLFTSAGTHVVLDVAGWFS